ncbi:hypothetical protein J4Q44_G00039380 [Coregonus suidteri]|uniref:Uncharacterized protein n=1 Tax=Coregonus suidteri TaxID=861788 RepID=A0AAN8MEA0_9TELE
MAIYINKQVIELNKVTEENRNRATRSVKTDTHLSGPEDSGRRLYRMVAVSFGMLCVLQVTLNISLRLVFTGTQSSLIMVVTTQQMGRRTVLS